MPDVLAFAHVLAASSEFSIMPSAGERLLIRLGVYAFILLLLGVASLAYAAFPERRRTMCRTSLIAGFTLLIPFFAMVWSGNAENMGEWTPFIVVAGGAGALLVFFGFMLLKKINRDGEIEEQI